MNSFIANLTIARKINAVRRSTGTRAGRGGSAIFRECPRGTPGRRALRKLDDAAVARAVAKAGGVR